MGSVPIFSPTQLAAHLACPHYTQLERRRRAGELAVELLPDPRIEAMRTRGEEHERAYVARLKTDGGSVCELRGERDPAATLAAMREGHRVIVQAPLANGAFRGVADVLRRVELPSALGGWSYEPLDTKLARETKAGTILQLSTYCEMLAAMQERLPEAFHVVTPVGEERYRTRDFAAYYRFVRARLHDAVGAQPPPATYPEPVAHCDVCAYWNFCDEHRRRDDHPSLIADVRTAHVREFQRQGMATLAAIARAEGRLPERPIRGAAATFERHGHQARLQLAARTSALPPVELLPVEEHRGLRRLPEPSPGDVFLDFEGDPFVGEHGLEYLTGYWTGDGVCEQHWALDAGEEKLACERFIDFVMARLEHHPGMHVYHFGHYEPAALKRLCARHATRGEALDRLLRGRRFVDLHSIVRQAFRIGVERYGLKELEPLHAYERSLELRDAAFARRDLEIALELGNRERIDAELRDLVAAYNRDDCRSTAALRAWLERERAKAVEGGQPIDRPPLAAMEPSAQVSERDRRIQSLQQDLIAALPADPAARSAEEQARALLASLLGYFRQEAKNAWWEYYRLRELPVEEHMEEREMLAGLKFVGVDPPKPGERNPRHRYAFPPQDTAIDAGDKVVFTKAEDPNPDGSGTVMDVAEIDPVAGTVVLKLGGAAARCQPSAVFRKPFTDNEPLEQALLAFAESVREHGFASTGPYGAASQLLLRPPPRLRSRAGGPLRHPGESTLQAVIRLCGELDGGVLPIQGPPGSGKTFSGARAIVALARNHRVGITAVSHKVIDNLLNKIRKCMPSESPLRLVHKDDEESTPQIEYLKKPRDALAAIRPGTVVGGTVWLWASDDARECLDYLFVDEAGQMALASALAGARCARNVVLLGDPQQLEQPTKGAHPDGADVAALVHVIGKGQATVRDEQGVFLERTFRLHPEICAFTSELYYESRLLPTEGLERQRLGGETPFAGAGLFLVEVPHEGNQADAPEEVQAVSEIARGLLRPGVTWTGQDGAKRALRPNDILVVAPYNAQVSALKRALAPLSVTRVGTVDKFQGQQAPLVIYSCTASSSEDAPRGMAFLYDPHRFNVATSRAQGVVIVVASPRLFEAECRSPEQMLWANGLCRYREFAELKWEGP